jgi:hypothetical protein
MLRATVLLSLAAMTAGCAADPQNRPGHVQAGIFDVDWVASTWEFFFPHKREAIDPSREPDGYIGNLKTRSRNPTPAEREAGYAWRDSIH